MSGHSIYILKNVLKNTPIYPLYRKYKDKGQKRAAVEKIRAWSEIDQTRFEFYKQFICAGDLVFDVGANLGNRSKVFLKLGARVVGFEPHKYCSEILREAFKNEPRFTLRNCALGEEQGRGELMLSHAHTISSMSSSWINAVTKSGRFSQYDWGNSEEIEVRTLDSEIEKFGTPSFIKIDVEGFELEVLLGLSHIIEAISIEYTPEHKANTIACIELLGKLGRTRYRYSAEESMKWTSTGWLTSDEIMKSLPSNGFGDLYVKTDLHYSPCN